MTKLLSLDDFVQNLCASGLLTRDEVHRLLDAMPLAASDSDAFAKQLVAAEKLTPFQLERVREARFDELRIANYQVLDRLGEGGMGTVYKALHRRMKRVVAIKVLSPAVAKSDKFIKRFHREVEAVSRLTHPNIVMAYDADEAEAGHYLVMEFVNGHDLSHEMQRRGQLPVGEAVYYMIQASRALEYAHSQGIVHRDIKPANLLRDAGGLIKVADLGLARFEEGFGAPTDDGSALTQAGSIMGTVDFMSPEQAMGMSGIDYRADIYSLGCTLYFLLVGRPPYQGQTMMATLLMHREAPIPSLRSVRRDVPVDLDLICRRMLAKSPADRYPTMTEVLRDLEAVQSMLGGRTETPTDDLGFEINRDASAVAPLIETGAKTTLGASSESASQTIDVAPITPLPEPPATVLLVEPSRTQSAIIRKYLQAQGVNQIISAVSGEEALKVTRLTPPDAIVSAMHLPDMSGVRLAERVRAETKGAVPGFVLISSEGDSTQGDSLSKCGQAIMLQKPFTPAHLRQALRVVSQASQQLTIPATPRGKLRVLVVDDSSAARAHVRGVLQSLGVSEFVEAFDGAQAVAAVSKDTFDLVVTDYNMPYMDGRALVGYLKQNPTTASVPIIMVTTEVDPAKLESVRQLGVAGICGKSFPKDQVRTIIDRIVRAK